MEEIRDIKTGDSWIQLNEEEIKFGFLSQCIEAVAEANNCGYLEMLERLENVNMTQGYILAHYNVLHTESMENIVSSISELLRNRESEICV